MSKLITIGQLLDETWDRYTIHFKTLMRIAGWLLTVSAIWILGVILAPTGDASFAIEQGLITPLERAGLILTGVSSTLLYAVVTVWVFIMLVLALGQLDKKQKTDVRTLNMPAWKQFFPYVLMMILRAFLFSVPLLAIVPGFILIFINLTTEGGAVLGALSLLFTFLGVIAALILVITFGVFLAFPGYELLLNGKGVVEALKGSYALVKGRFWAVFFRLLIPKALITIVTIIAEIFLFVIFILILTNSPGLSDAAMSRISDIVGNLALTGLTVIITPLYVIADYLVYGSLRETR